MTAGLALTAVTRIHRGRRSLGRRRSAGVTALADLTLSVPAGTRLGVVGESGSGKSTLLRLLAGLDRPTAGTVRVDGHDPAAELTAGRGRTQLVFQDPGGSLDPRMRVGDLVGEPLPAGPDRRDRVLAALAEVELPAEVVPRYPHQFSGGQRQRIALARALAPRPDVLLADEPVSALDAGVRASVLALLDRVARERQLLLVLVSHDLSVVRQVCDRVVVLRAGRVVEDGTTAQVLQAPAAAYTRELLAAVPTLAGALARTRARVAATGPG